MKVSCGVLVTDGRLLLLVHPTGGLHWDLPKGIADPGEPEAVAAARELGEETGLSVDPAVLRPLGHGPYIPGKALSLFLWRVDRLPDPAGLVCTSYVSPPGRRPFPEVDAFGCFPAVDVESLCSPALAGRLAAVRALWTAT
jgi:putative (di)nucleoside polyphosphate hydrolase